MDLLINSAQAITEAQESQIDAWGEFAMFFGIPLLLVIGTVIYKKLKK